MIMALFCQSTPSWIKVGVVVVGAKGETGGQCSVVKLIHDAPRARTRTVHCVIVLNILRLLSVSQQREIAMS